MIVNRKIHSDRTKEKIKTNKIEDDWRDYIATLYTGFSSGNRGTYLFLAKCKKLVKSKLKNITSNFKAPGGSEVIVTPYVLVNNDAWF